MTKFWDSTASSLSTRLLDASGPALIFWVWAGTVWAISKSGGWASLTSTLSRYFDYANGAGTSTLLTVAAACLTLVTVSSLIVARAALPILRILEGYWPTQLGISRIAGWRCSHWHRKLQTLEQDLLQAQDAGDHDAGARIQTKLRNYPPNDADLLPTRIGNIIRAGERRPHTWYGLDPIVVWPQLWLVLPEQPRNDLAHSREQLDRSVTAFAWAVLSCALAVLWPWAALTGALVAAAIWYWWIGSSAATFATLLSAVFDTHRFLLYDALHYPLPTDAATEPVAGRALTQALWTDTKGAPTYVHDTQ